MSFPWLFWSYTYFNPRSPRVYICNSSAFVQLKDSNDLKELRRNLISFAFYYQNSEDLKVFSRIAEIYQDTLAFGVTNERSLLEKIPSSAKYALVWYNDGEPEIFSPDKSLDAVALEKWILERKYPHFVQYEATSWRHFSGQGKLMVIGVFKDSQTKSYDF